MQRSTLLSHLANRCAVLEIVMSFTNATLETYWPLRTGTNKGVARMEALILLDQI
jgi:hypothetical protein